MTSSARAARRAVQRSVRPCGAALRIAVDRLRGPGPFGPRIGDRRGAARCTRRAAGGPLSCTIRRDVRTDRAARGAARHQLPASRGPFGLHRRVRPGRIAPGDAGRGRRGPFHGAHHVQGDRRVSRRRGRSARPSRASAARSTRRPIASRRCTGSACRAARRPGRWTCSVSSSSARSWTDGEIEGERTVIIEEIRSYQDDPAEYAQTLFQTALFGDGPLGREICGDEAGHPGAARTDAIRDFWRTMYRPAQHGRRRRRRPRPRRGRGPRRPRVRDRQRRRSRATRRRRRCRPASASGSASARPTQAQLVRRRARRCRAITPTAGPWPSSTRSSATG